MNKISANNAFPTAVWCAIATVCSFFINESLTAKELTQQSFYKLNSNNAATYSKQQSTSIEKKTNHCQSIDSKYKEFYNFETFNYNISICYQNENWFYFRQSKSNPLNYLFLPAEIVFGGDFFRAKDKKVTYFVGVNSNGYYSSVMYENNQIVFEPELSKTSIVTEKKSDDNIVPVEELVPKTVIYPDSEVNSDID